MERIFKYPVPVTDFFTLELPTNYRILTVQIQYGDPYLWAVVNDEYSNTEALFKLYGTGSPIDDHGERYVGTFQLRSLVFHLFHVQKLK
tara:strand:- start:158 stop:424 length:267 start_codon:yes stop_codon:yes gene_type:complete